MGVVTRVNAYKRLMKGSAQLRPLWVRVGLAASCIVAALLVIGFLLPPLPRDLARVWEWAERVSWLAALAIPPITDTPG